MIGIYSPRTKRAQNISFVREVKKDESFLSLTTLGITKHIDNFYRISIILEEIINSKYKT